MKWSDEGANVPRNWIILVGQRVRGFADRRLFLPAAPRFGYMGNSTISFSSIHPRRRRNSQEVSINKKRFGNA